MTRGKYIRRPDGNYGRKPDAELDAATLDAIAALEELGFLTGGMV